MIATVLLSTLGGVIALVLFVPLSVRADGAAGDDELWGAAELRWGHSVAMVRLQTRGEGRFYLLGIPLFRTSGLLGKSEKKKKKKKPKKKEDKKKKERRSISQLLADGGVIAQMASRALLTFHPRLYLGGTVGFNDPANTAVVVTAARQLDQLITDRVVLDIHDDFLQESTQLFGRMRVWVMPAEIVFVLLSWVVRSDTRRVLQGK